MGHLNRLSIPTLGNLTESLGPRVWMFDFFLRRTETESRVARDGYLETGSP